MKLPEIIRVLAEWEDANGTLCAITPDEWMALMEPIATFATLESPRMVRNAFCGLPSQAPSSGIDRETVIRLARQAVNSSDGSELSGDAIERFAQLVFLEAAAGVDSVDGEQP
jgi:hypothetical protein